MESHGKSFKNYNQIPVSEPLLIQGRTPSPDRLFFACYRF